LLIEAKLNDVASMFKVNCARKPIEEAMKIAFDYNMVSHWWLDFYVAFWLVAIFFLCVIWLLLVLVDYSIFSLTTQVGYQNPFEDLNMSIINFIVKVIPLDDQFTQ
jgi:hypothetical protein